MAAKLPYMFLGSSDKGLPIAKAIQSNLQYVCEPHIWSQGLFGLSGGTLETLVSKLDSFDFAVLCLTPDDLTVSRGQEKQSPRDNVILELGLFIASLGRERVFFVVDREADTKIPSDLAGITPAQYIKPQSGNWQSALGPASTAIEDAIRTLGRRQQSPYKLKLWPSYMHGIDGRGIRLTVTNEDEKDLPPYEIWLYNPHRGSLGIFPSEKDGTPLLSGQERKHDCLLFPSGVRGSFITPQMVYQDDRGIDLSEEVFHQWTLRIKLVDSDRVLFENAQYGLALATVMRSAGRTGGPAGISNELWELFSDDTAAGNS